MGTAEMQGRLWGPGARDWSELNEPSCVPFYEAVFDAIAVRPGTALLDAGCGGGFALQLAAKRGAAVTGFDACGPLLDIARERVPDADLRQGDLESLPFAEHMFDAVTAFNSIQFAADLLAVMRELRRVARPGAPVAILIWGAPERCESRVILAAIGGLLPPPPPGAEGPFALSAPGKLEELAETAGLVPEGRTKYRPRSFIQTWTPPCAPSCPQARRGWLSSMPASRPSERHWPRPSPTAASLTAVTARTTSSGT